jgi:4-diphosphocytidyl-2-C-methyl-D-erythritol kinase
VTGDEARDRAYAKVNLWLAVHGLRPDGYHEIETIFHAIDLFDEIEVSVTEPGPVEVEMEMQFDDWDAAAPASETNLAVRAANSFRDAAGHSHGVQIRILKRIPIGAGLGGGSSDAACVLNLLRDLLGGPTEAQLRNLAAGLGSDVPFFLTGGTALGTGRGDEVVCLARPPDLHLVLGLTDRGLATPDVYAEYDRLAHPPGAASDGMRTAIAAGNPAGIAALLRNDLEPAAVALRPGITRQLGRMRDAGALGAIVGGSGPTVVGIARDRAHARELGKRVRDAFDRVAVAASAPSATSAPDASPPID